MSLKGRNLIKKKISNEIMFQQFSFLSHGKTAHHFIKLTDLKSIPFYSIRYAPRRAQGQRQSRERRQERWRRWGTSQRRQGQAGGHCSQHAGQWGRRVAGRGGERRPWVHP